MSKEQQRKGAEGELDLTALLRRAGYSAKWGGNRTYGAVPDISGLPGVHIECKCRERLNLTEAMGQAVRDAERFGDGAPTVFHRRNNQPWLVTMQLPDWLTLYAAANCDHDAHARFFNTARPCTGEKGTLMNNFWESEKPISVDIGKNVIEYFPTAKSLSVSKPNWTDRKTGETKRGKTVLLDLEAVSKNPDAVALLTRVLTDLKKN